MRNIIAENTPERITTCNKHLKKAQNSSNTLIQKTTTNPVNHHSQISTTNPQKIKISRTHKNNPNCHQRLAKTSITP